MAGKTYRLGAKAFLEATDADLDALARQTCQEMAFRVVQATPVDIGFLRGSWQPSIGEAMVKDSATVDPSGFGVQGEVGLVVAGMKAGDVFYMINNCEYGPNVEFGTSRMEGQFYVQNTVAQFQQVAADVAADLKVGA